MTDNETQDLKKERDTAMRLEQLEEECDVLQERIKQKRSEIYNLRVDEIRNESVGKTLFINNFDIPTYIKVTDVTYSETENKIYFCGYVFSSNFETEFRDNHWFDFNEDSQIDMCYDIDKKSVQDYGFSVVDDDTMERVFKSETKKFKKAFRNAFELK